MRRNGLCSGACAAALGAFLVFFSVVATSSAVRAASGQEVLKIGFVSALSGPGAVWGIPFKNCTLLDAEEINAAGGVSIGGKKYMIEIIAVDDFYTSEGGKAAAEKLVYQDKVKFIVGSQGSTQTLGMETVTVPANVLIYPAAQSPKILGPDKPLTFRCGPDATITPIASWAYVQDKYPNLKTIALMSTNDEYGKAVAKAQKQFAELLGLQVVAEEYFSRAGAKDFYPILGRVKGKNPDAIELGGSASPDSALIVKQARELGYNGLLFCTSSPVEPGSFVEIAGKQNAEGFLNNILNDETPGLPPEVQAFKKRYLAKHQPFYPVAYLYGWPVKVLTQAMEKADSLDPVKVAAVLENMQIRKPLGVGFYAGEQKEWYGIKRQFIGPQYVSEFQSGVPVTVKILGADKVFEMNKKYWRVQ